MNLRYDVIGNQARFFREGAAFTQPANGVASRNSKPGAADAAWHDLGHIAFKAKPNVETDEIFRPAPGKLQRYDVIELKRSLDLTITAMELQNLVFESLFGSLALALTGAGGQFNPFEGKSLKGWLKIQQYGQDNALLNTVDMFAYLQVGEIDFGEKKVEAEFTCKSLWSPLNTGTLA